MLHYIFSRCILKGAIHVMRVIKGSLKKHNAFTKKDMLQGIALCTKSHASFAYHHRSMQMNLKQKHQLTNSLKKVSCAAITVFLLGAPATAHPESPTSRLYLPQHFTLIHLLDHNIPSFQEKPTPAEILHIRTVGPSFLMGPGAWNELGFPDPGTRFSAITGRKHRPRLLRGQRTGKAGDPHGLYHICGRTPRHLVGFSDSVLSSYISKVPRAHLLLHSTSTSSQVSVSLAHARFLS